RRRIADLLAREVLDALDARALEPVHALRRVGIDVEHGDRVGALALGDEHAAHVRESDRIRAGADLLRRERRAFARLEVEIDAFLLVPTELLCVVVRRMVAAGHPVEDEVDLLLCCRRRCDQRGCRGDDKAAHGASSLTERRCYHRVTDWLTCTGRCPRRLPRFCAAAPSSPPIPSRSMRGASWTS